jgi:hypothetical protein
MVSPATRSGKLVFLNASSRNTRLDFTVSRPDRSVALHEDVAEVVAGAMRTSEAHAVHCLAVILQGALKFDLKVVRSLGYLPYLH